MAAESGWTEYEDMAPVPSGKTQHTRTQRLREGKEEAINSLKARLFDPKRRAIGIDKDALDEQVREKKAIRDQEKAVNDYYDQQALLQDKYAIWLEGEQAKQRQERELEAQVFRNQKQQSSKRREAHLNDKTQLKAELPPRLGDDDPRCTVSGCQMFEGEDLDAPARRRVQAQQLTSWAEQQIQEKNLKKNLQREADKLQSDRTESVTHKAWACERSVESARTERAIANAEFNKRLAEQKDNEKLSGKHFEQQCNMQEIQNMLDSDFLNEDARVTVNATRGTKAGIGAPAYKRDNMKGLHPEQRQAIVAEQAAQREENMSRRKAEKQESMHVNLQEEQERRMATALDRQRGREKRSAMRGLAEERKTQARDAALKKAHLDNLYTNQITDEFYSFVDKNPR